MGVRSVPLLAALFLLLSSRPGLADGGAGPAACRPSTSAAFRWTTAQTSAGQEKEAPEPEPRRPGEKIELSLEKSIEIALRNNLGISIAWLAREAVQTEVPRAGAIFHPVAGLAVTASEEKTAPNAAHASEVMAQTATPFVRTLVPTGASITVSGDFIRRKETRSSSSTREFESAVRLILTQPLLRGGRVYVARKPIRDAEFDLRVEEARLRAEILRETAATKSAYYTMILAERVITLTEAAIERDTLLIETSRALFKAGLVTIRDVFSAEISHAKDLAKLVSARADLDVATNALAGVLGIPIETEVVILDKVVSFQSVDLKLEQWIDAAVRNRPEILEVDERLGKSSLNVRTAKNTLLPQTDLVTSYERAQTGSTFGRSLDLTGHAWSAGLVFSIPIGNAAARSALARAEIEHAQLRQELSQRKRQVELEVRAAVIKLRRSQERMKALGMVVDQARGKMEVAQARFALGLTTNLDITDAQEDLLNAETDLLKAAVDYNIGLAELEASVAGPM